MFNQTTKTQEISLESTTHNKPNRMDITLEKTIESLARCERFLANTPRVCYSEAYKKCNADTLDPYATFLVKSLDMIKKLHKPLQSVPDIMKNTLAKSVLNNIINMRYSLIESGHIPSLALSKAKETSSYLHKLHSDLDVLCGLEYISNNFYSKLFDDLSELNQLLLKWFDIIKTHNAKPSKIN